MLLARTPPYLQSPDASKVHPPHRAPSGSTGTVRGGAGLEPALGLRDGEELVGRVVGAARDVRASHGWSL